MRHLLALIFDTDLISKINGRQVIVDACVSRELAEGLKKTGLKVRHVADINTALKDNEIAKMMYADEVLITKDCRFFKMLGEHRAILLAPKGESVDSSRKLSRSGKRKGAKKKTKLPSHIRIALRQKLAEEARTGLLYAKILWGIMWLIGFPVP